MAKLYIVGTPIGNMSDITFRAVEVLRSVDVIACEDTRHSKPLLARYGVNARLIAYHKFNEQECADRIADMVARGEDAALITDAGMPSVSDPGAAVAALFRERGLEMEVVPGPSAVTAALAACGIKASGFVFLGFLPEKKSAADEVVLKAAASELPLAIYVAPHDLIKTASSLYELLGDRKAYVCRELTKIHESVKVTSLGNFECDPRGEIVLIIEGACKENELNNLSIEQHFNHYLSLGVEKKQAIKNVASDRNLPKNEVYQQLLDN